MAKKSTAQEKSPQDNTPFEDQGGQGGGELGEMISSASAEDPLVRFFQEKSNVIFWTLAAIALVWYGTYQYQMSYRNSLRDAADVYAYLSTELDAYADVQRALSSSAGESEAGEGQEELRTEANELTSRIEASLSALQQEKSPYDLLGYLQGLRFALLRGDVEKAQGDLKIIQDEVGEDPAKLFIAELAKLRLGRSLLDKDGRESEGKQMLFDLLDARYVASSAAKALSSLDLSAEEKKSLQDKKSLLQESRPEQAPFLGLAEMPS